MTEKEIEEILNKLSNGELSQYFVEKQDFLPFRAVLVKRKDFKHFRGISQRGGNVLYEYTEAPRS